MDQQLTMEIKQHIDAQYALLSQVLLNQESYEANNITTDHLKDYLSFLEKALVQSYNRIAHIHTFVDDPDGLMTGRMYPFCFLSKNARTHIIAIYQQTEKLVLGFSALSPSTELLEQEPHEAQMAPTV